MTLTKSQLKTLNHIDALLSEAFDTLSELQSSIDESASTAREKFDDMSERRQESDAGQRASEKADTLENLASIAQLIAAWRRYGVAIEADTGGYWQWQSVDDNGNDTGPYSPPFRTLAACINDAQESFGELPSEFVEAR